MLCRRRDGLHLGMCRHVVQKLSLVVALGDDLVPANNDCPDGYLALLVRLRRFRQRLLHVNNVRFINHLAIYLFTILFVEKRVDSLLIYQNRKLTKTLF